MNNNINLIAFGTFGNPNGFRQTFFIGNRELSKSVKTFDLNTNAIKLFQDAGIYAIRKEYAAGHNIISYSVYSFAKEQNSERSGTFIGSSILFTGKIAEENITIKLLNEFQKVLFDKNVINDVISVNHSDQFSVSKPSDFDKTEYHLKEIEDLNFIQNSNKVLVVFCETKPDKLQAYFRQSIDLLNVYDTIYFTQSKEVAEFVAQKGIFKLIQNVGDKKEFDLEIQTLQAERKRKIEASISDFEKEISRLEEDKNKTLNEFKEQIDRNEQAHQENEKKIRESKNDLEQVKIIYYDFSSKIKDYSNQLRSGRKLDDVKKLCNENKRIFIDSIQQVKRPNFINNISKAKANTGLKNEPQPLTTNGNNWTYEKGRTRREHQPKIDIFKVATLALLLLLIGTWSWFLFFKNEEPNREVVHQEVIEETNSNTNIPNPNSSLLLTELNPIPQSELNENDYRNVAKKLSKDTKLADVVKVIFDNNPTQIRAIYSGQEELYGKHLIEKNKDCFKEKNGSYFFVKDTLKHIPSK